MQTQLLTSPALGFTTQEHYEYLLVVNPAETVSNEVMEEKKLFTTKYKAKIAAATKPHITVANFLAKESMEETIIRYMHRILSAQKSFMVNLNNYSGFPPHTIYIRVQQQYAFAQLAEALKPVSQYIQGNGYPAARFITRPHVTIARRLQEAVYNKAMPDYSQKLFGGEFMVNELVLLKRQNQYDACKQVNVFRLMGND